MFKKRQGNYICNILFRDIESYYKNEYKKKEEMEKLNRE